MNKSRKKTLWPAAKIVFGLANAALLAALVADGTGARIATWGWLAKIQWVPAALALNGVALALLVIVAVWRGRLYCETLCPLGIAQELVRFVARKRVRRVCTRLPEPRVQRIVRWSVFAAAVLTAVLAAFGFAVPSLLVWTDPYGIFMRAMAWLKQPNPCALLTVASLGGFLLVLVLAGVGKGRIWCNWICPVGTLLNCFSKICRSKDAYDPCAHCERCGKCLKK